MIEVLSDWWQAIAGSTAVSAALGFFGVRTYNKIEKTAERVGVLEAGKCDRAELKDLMTLMEERDKESRDSRRRLHDKLDASIASQGDINREMARYIGGRQ